MRKAAAQKPLDFSQANYHLIQKSKSSRVTTISISADDFIPLRRCIFRRRNLFSWHVYKYENRLYIHNYNRTFFLS